MAIDQATKILIVLQAGTESRVGRARALHGVMHGVLHARELTEAGATVRLVCDYCAGAFDVKDELVEAAEALAGADMDHPSLAAHVADGLAAWIL